MRRLSFWALFILLLLIFDSVHAGNDRYRIKKKRTKSPTLAPTASPVASPTASPVASPTASPVAEPTTSPVASPTASPVASPTASPVASPTASPVASPTASPVVYEPTASPVVSEPTASPVVSEPTASPVVYEPTASPSVYPSASPTLSPSPQTNTSASISNPETIVKSGGKWLPPMPNWAVILLASVFLLLLLLLISAYRRRTSPANPATYRQGRAMLSEFMDRDAIRREQRRDSLSLNSTFSHEQRKKPSPSRKSLREFRASFFRRGELGTSLLLPEDPIEEELQDTRPGDTPTDS